MKKFFISITASLVALSSLLMMPISASAAADTCTWTGATNNLWSVGTNWSGCDNGGVPETGDNLIFPAVASNVATNNDLAITPKDVTFSLGGSGYSVSGNTMELSGTLNVFSSTSFNSLVKFTANSGAASLNVQLATPTFSAGGIDLNLTGTANFSVFTTNSSLDLPIFTGTTNTFYFMGNPTAPIEVFNTSISPSSFTASQVDIWRSGVNCQSNNCFGDDTNPVRIAGADTGTQAFVRLNSAGMVLANPLTFDDTGVLVGPSFLDVAQNATTTGTITVTDDATIAVAASTSLLLNGGVSLGSSTLTYSVGSGGQITHNGVITGAGNIIIDGYVQMINGNSYTGSTTVNSGGILIISNASGLGTTAGSTTVNSGGTLQFNPFVPISVAEDITVAGTGRPGSSGAIEEYNASNDVTLTGNVVLTGNTQIGQGLAGTGVLRFDGIVSGTGNITVSGFNNSLFRFGGTSANTYVGSFTITGGQIYLSKTAGVTAITGDASAIASPAGNASIYLASNDQIADTSHILLYTDTGLGLLTVDSNDSIDSVSGNGTISFSAGTSLGVDSSTNSTFSGNMQKSSAGSDPQFVKAGTGTVTLTGTLSPSAIGYPQFVVNGGKLLSNGDYSNSNFTSNSGATLGGAGQTGATTINSGAVLSPGNSPGCIGTASLNLTSGANFDEELAGPTACTEYDQTTVTGAANLNNANLNIIPSFTPANGQVFTIIQAGSIVGTFNGLADNSQITINGLVFRVNYSGTTVTLTYIAGTLAPTGQNSNQTAAIAFAILGLALAGLGIEYISRRRNV